MSKITALVNKTNAGNYHRLQLPLSKIENVTFVDNLTEDILKETDILWLHWAYEDIVKLSAWKYKYGFSIVLDIDDTWVLHKRSGFFSYHTMMLADRVICSTQYISEGIIEKPSIVIPNRLPIGEGQFTPRKTEKNEKIKVGIAGSLSHFNNWMSLRRFLQRCKQDKIIMDNIEFVIAGYNNTKEWERVKKLFPKEPELRYSDFDSYMDTYEGIDIMLCPLLFDSINRGRSSIKLLECISKSIIPFVDEEYILKGDVDWKIDSFIERSEWLSKLKEYCLNRDTLYEDQKKIYSLLSDLDYNSVIEQRKQIIKELENKEEEISKNLITTIIYDDKHPYDFYPYKNTIKTKKEKSYLFEYNVILSQMEYYKKTGYLENARYVGFFSWKFPYKTGYYSTYVNYLLDRESSDIVIFCKQEKEYLKITERDHPGFTSIFKILCDKLGFRFKESKYTVYSNFFVAKPDIYLEYAELIKRAISLLETDNELKFLAWRDSNYPGLSKEDLKLYTGLDYYPMHTFLLERLFSVWIDTKPYKIKVA